MNECIVVQRRLNGVNVQQLVEWTRRLSVYELLVGSLSDATKPIEDAVTQ